MNEGDLGAKVTKRIDLNVPFAEKDRAKELGAKWDFRERTWFVPPGVDPQAFERWLPDAGQEVAEDDLLVLFPPVFTVASQTACWKCDEQVDVATLACTRYQDPEEVGEVQESTLFVIAQIARLPAEALASLREINPGYRRKFSRTAGIEYFMNHCHCGAHLGDFFLHMEPGGAFLPVDSKSASRIRLKKLSSDKPIKTGGSPAVSVPNLIAENAVRVR